MCTIGERKEIIFLPIKIIFNLLFSPSSNQSRQTSFGSDLKWIPLKSRCLALDLKKLTKSFGFDLPRRDPIMDIKMHIFIGRACNRRYIFSHTECSHLNWQIVVFFSTFEQQGLKCQFCLYIFMKRLIW